MSMNSLKSHAAGALVAIGVLVAGLAVGRPEAGADQTGNAPRLGPPPALGNHGEIPLGDGLTLWGNPAQLSLFWTTDSPEQVVRTYFESWQSAGFEPMVNELGNISSVWFVEPATGLMRSVTVMSQGDDTLVLPGVSDARQLPDPTARNAPFPVPENATGYLAHAADDTHSISYTASFGVALSPSRALDFYKLELGNLGYEFVDSLSRTGEAMHGEFRRGPESVTVVASKVSQDEDRSSFVFVTHVRGTM